MSLDDYGMPPVNGVFEGIDQRRQFQIENLSHLLVEFSHLLSFSRRTALSFYYMKAESVF